MPPRLSSTTPAKPSWASRCITGGLNWIYPPVCAACGRAVILAGNRGPSLCGPCNGELGDGSDRLCERCGAPLGPYLVGTNGCKHCRGRKFPFETVLSLGAYDGLLRDACLKGKRSGGAPLVAALASRLCTARQPQLAALNIAAVVAVPHYWSQRWNRPHNPAAVMADVLSSRLKVPFYRHILAKVRKTQPQTSLPPTRRRTNLRNAFQVRRSGPVSGKTILLVDDVLTTGATAGEISRKLLAANARRVVVAVIARGLGRRLPDENRSL